MSEVPVGKVSLARIFSVFAWIGVTSFGGGIVAYLRRALVENERWLDDEEFMAALEISQTLPGLNSTNMSVIVGRKLRGPVGALVAVLGMILPGALIVMALGFAYVRFRHNPDVAIVLTGVAAAAVGLLLQVTLKIGWKQLIRPRDLALVVVVFVLVGVFHVSLLVTLVCVAPLAIWLNRPRKEAA
jgi:chromate transporter